MLESKKRPIRRIVGRVTAVAALGTLLGAMLAAPAFATPSSTLTVSPGTATAGTANDLTFTFTSGNGTSAGKLTIPMPSASWPAPTSVTTNLVSGCTSATASVPAGTTKIVVTYNCTAGGSFTVLDAGQVVSKKANNYVFLASVNASEAPITTEPNIVITPGPLAKFAVTSSSTSVDSMVPFNATVTALDQYKNTVMTYTGTVVFSDNDVPPKPPASYTFTTGAGGDNGVHTFSVQLRGPGSRTLAVADKSNTALNGHASYTVSPPTNIIVTPSAPSIVRGTTQQFAAEVQYADSTDITNDAFVSWLTTPGGIGLLSNTTPGLVLGVHAGSTTVDAQLAGVDSASTGGGGALTVTSSSTGTALASSANPSVSGQLVTYTATVNVPGAATGTPAPTGSVAFVDGSTTLCSAVVLSVPHGAPVATATATCQSSPTVSNGPHSITATYTPDNGDNTGSSSTPLTQTVNADNVTIAATSAGRTFYGETATINVSVAANAPGTGAPDGTVNICTGACTGSNTIGSGTLSGGAASVSVGNALPGGTNNLGVQYIPGASGNFNASTTSVNQVVHATTEPVNISSTDVSNGGSVSEGTTPTPNFTIAIPGAIGTAGTSPTGSVLLTATPQGGGSPILVGVGTVSDDGSGNATVTIQWNLAGSGAVIGTTYNLVAHFDSGDGNYTDNHSAAYVVTVTS